MNAITPNNIHDGRNMQYNLILISHKIKFQVGSKNSIDLVKPTSSCNPGIIACKINDTTAAGINIRKKRNTPPTTGALAISFIHSTFVLTSKINNDINFDLIVERDFFFVETY